MTLAVKECGPTKIYVDYEICLLVSIHLQASENNLRNDMNIEMTWTFIHSSICVVRMAMSPIGVGSIMCAFKPYSQRQILNWYSSSNESAYTLVRESHGVPKLRFSCVALRRWVSRSVLERTHRSSWCLLAWRLLSHNVANSKLTAS